MDLNLSYNKLTSISWDICQLQMLQYLDLSYNAIENMPPKFYWTCSNLRKLNLAYNKVLDFFYNCGDDNLHLVVTQCLTHVWVRFGIDRDF